jgi:hypothetical protein
MVSRVRLIHLVLLVILAAFISAPAFAADKTKETDTRTKAERQAGHHLT